MSDSSPSNERDLSEYLGKDRDELRGIIGERDSEIVRLQQKLLAAEQLAVRQGNEIRRLRAGERA